MSLKGSILGHLCPDLAGMMTGMPWGRPKTCRAKARPDSKVLSAILGDILPFLVHIWLAGPPQPPLGPLRED